jgi:hypothetical protein
MYFTILILEAECIVNGTRVAVNRDILSNPEILRAYVLSSIS